MMDFGSVLSVWYVYVTLVWTTAHRLALFTVVLCQIPFPKAQATKGCDEYALTEEAMNGMIINIDSPKEMRQAIQCSADQLMRVR